MLLELGELSSFSFHCILASFFLIGLHKATAKVCSYIVVVCDFIVVLSFIEATKCFQQQLRFAKQVADFFLL